MLDHRDYDVWGNITNETHPTYADRYGWTGRELQAETDLQYNRARWYDSATGRWQTQDALGFGAGDSNLYRYVRNDVTIYKDPSGLDHLNPEQLARTQFFAALAFLQANQRRYTMLKSSYDNLPRLMAATRDPAAILKLTSDARFDMFLQLRSASPQLALESAALSLSGASLELRDWTAAGRTAIDSYKDGLNAAKHLNRAARYYSIVLVIIMFR